ncbi:MAG: hypothetical protein C4294_20250 [Nitrospiraceae bacterium]
MLPDQLLGFIGDLSPSRVRGLPTTASIFGTMNFLSTSSPAVVLILYGAKTSCWGCNEKKSIGIMFITAAGTFTFFIARAIEQR